MRPLGDPTSLFYEEVGEGPPVVLIHGLADDHRLWRHQVPALATRFRTVAIDIRGHGSSPKPPGPYSVPLFATDVVALLDQLGIERASFIGLSMGGGISQTLALRHAERVQAIALLSTSSSFPQKTRDRFHSRAATAEREGMGPIVASMIERWFTPHFRAEHPDEVELTRATVLANDPFAFAAAARANAERDWTNALDAIRCPVLFIGGAEDPGDARHSAATFAEHLPQLEAHIIDNASHLLPVERPLITNDLLLRFLASSGG
jgi:3-oxoadipate enol-lactonase